MNLIQTIGNYATEHPQWIAVESAEGSMTYGELWDKSGRLATWLNTEAGEDRSPLVVYGGMEASMISRFLACSRSGRAYCPVDRTMSVERVRDIVDAVGNQLILDTEPDTEGLIPTENMLPPETYYMIYTSGSTGKPKGVMITGDNLEQYTRWSVGLDPGIGNQCRILNQASLSFDLSVMGVYTALAAGGTIVMMNKEMQEDAGARLEYLKQKRVEIWVSTPSFLDVCLADERFNATELPEIRAFLFCGEALRKNTVELLFRRFPEARVVNTYGPTECTVCVTSVEITEDMLAVEEALPVGLAKPGTEIQLDPETNEIWILGHSVSPGYYKDPEKTERSFFRAVPTNLIPDADGKVAAYRTGDQGHFGEDGQLYCDGRIDLQIKFHGYRIELGDIEENINAIDGVAQAAVVPRRQEGVIRNLAAYVVREDGKTDLPYAERKHIRTMLKDKLPTYMIPKKVTFLSAMPLTSNGKLDRKALERMENETI